MTVFEHLPPSSSLRDTPILPLPLRIEDELIGFLVLRTRGEGKFTQEHVELLATVAEPFAIALANVLAHEQVIKYRDILIDDNRFLNREILSLAGDEIVGGNSGLRNVMEMVRQVAPLSNTVLLMGETGTGKEVIANAIHFASPRKDGPFIKVNCGAIPESLIDSELFGHEKGAFTGAVTEKRGRFERAYGGTIFLDEIGELPPQAQVRLLRVLQSREIERVGGDKTISGRYQGNCGHASQPGEHDLGKPVSGRSLVQVECVSNHRPTAKAAERRCTRPHTSFRGAEMPGTGDCHPPGHCARCVGEADEL